MDLRLDRKKKFGGDNKDSTFVDQVFSWSVPDLLDESFFMNKTLNAAGARSKRYEQHGRVGNLYGPFCFINITEGREEIDDDNFGRRNFVEIAVVMKIVQRLYEEWRCCSRTLFVVVLSPYAAQVVEIKRRLEKTHRCFRNIVLRVKTIEEFQDGEADIIILSIVKSNCTEFIESISDCQKTNAVFTKARHCLWILGSGNVLSKANRLWEAVISNAKECECFLNANDDEEMAQVISNVKSQLDELEDLLDMKSLIFKDARWKVMFSEMFVKSFSKLPSTYSKKVVLNFLLKLANGWRPKNYNADAVSESSIANAKQYKVESQYVICTNDICMESGHATQVLKVWDILYLVDVPELVSKLENIYSTFSVDHLRRCKDKCLEGNLEVPRRYDSINVSWDRGFRNADLPDTAYGTSYTENSKVKESLLLMKFYSFSAGVVSHLLSARDGTPINVPFEVTDQEREIILHQRSSFVLGRSGTGKTTVLVMKLFQKEQLHHMASEGFSELSSNASTSSLSFRGTCTTGTSLRQLFVTVNPKLCIAVKRHISNFQRFVCGETFGEEKIIVDVNYMDEYENFKDVPTSFVETPLKVYPLVVTFNMFLLMVDRTIGTSYFSRFPDMGKIFSQETLNSGLVHLNMVKRREVSYDKFRECYWPHFNSNLTNKLDPSRVFTEINTHIKGCLHFGQVGESNLCSETYIQLSDKKWSTFDEEERKRIYRIFWDYEKMKMARGEFDLADLVNDLHRRLTHEKYEGDCMDFVYVDEVQDLTMKQLALLKYICKNVKEGFVFAGDTAQTIAKGVHFRFEDITSLFYKEFLHGNVAAGQERKQEKGELSSPFHLSQNFRTHAGVLNLAQSITKLIYHFFPESIDKLKPETSLLRGEAPILLDCECHGDPMSLIFQNEGNDCENLISFGSEQVILVRDDRVKDEITKCIGRRAIVLTIFECKGLEFQDVLLYNFFGTSPLENEWRIIYEYMDQNKLRPANQESLSTFSHSKHNILCYELKQLYVAVTRTRQKLWICEDSGGFSSPMVRYWQELNIIQVKKLDDSYAREMPVISSSKDWKLQGLKMLEVRNYKIAAQSFERAGEDDWNTFARASELKEAAQNIRSLRLDKSLKMLEEAAELFKSISHKKKAAECFFDAEDYQKAGSIYYAESDIQRAGQCFTMAGRFTTAAEIYAEAFLFNECLCACSEGKLFDLGLKYIKSWEEDLTDLIQEAGIDVNATKQKFLEKCAFASYRQRDKVAMMKYVKDFNSLKSMLSFLKKLGCLNELLELLIDFEKYIDAAKLARQLGDILHEADLLEKGHHYQDASLLYLASVLAGSLWADNGEGWPLKEFPLKEELLSKAKASACKYMPHFHRIVCANIKLLSCDTYGFHDMHQQLALSRKNQNLMGQILSARKLLYLLPPKADLYVHLEAKGPTTKVPINTLFRHWNFWKDNIVKILSYLHSLKGKGPIEYPEYGEFCLVYLGVRKRSSDLDDGYFMLYPDAKWVTSVPRRSDKKDSLNVWQLVNAGERYWCSELLCVGIKVLETFESVLKLGSRNFMPVYCRRQVLVQIFEVAACLLTHCRFLKQTSLEWHYVMSYIDLSSEEYVSSVFSLDNNTLLTRDCITETVASRDILKNAIFRRFGSLIVYGKVSDIKKPTLSQLIQVVVVLLGSGRSIHDHHKEILRKFEIDSPWRPLLNDLVKDAVEVCHFRDALSDIYRSTSKVSHLISPRCFIYLLDRLLLMVSCFNGCLFATKSSVTEWLLHLDWKVNPETFLLGSGDISSMATSTFDFLAKTVHEILTNKQDMQEWAKKTGFDSENSFRLLTLKLVILQILICLNTGQYLELLNDLLLRSDIMARLPTVFQKVLATRSGSGFQNVIAEALQRIDDTLVVIRNPEIPKMYIQHAVFLNKFNLSKDKILEKLYAKAFTRQT